MKSQQDFRLTLLIDRFNLLERQLEHQVEKEVPIAQIRETGAEVDDTLHQICAHEPQTTQEEQHKFRFLLTKLVRRHQELECSEIVNALFAMCEDKGSSRRQADIRRN